MNKIFRDSYEAMPDVFTSTQFSEECRRRGLPRKGIRNSAFSDFLHRKKAIQPNGKRTRTWQKPIAKQKANTQDSQLFTEPQAANGHPKPLASFSLTKSVSTFSRSKAVTRFSGRWKSSFEVITHLCHSRPGVALLRAFYLSEKKYLKIIPKILDKCV